MPNRPEDKLTPKQARFIQEYLIDGNATQAAIRAGYKENTASAIGFENLRKPKIAYYLKKRLDKVSEKLDISVERVLQEMAKLAFVNMEDYVKFNEDGSVSLDFSRLNRDKAAAISEVTVDTFLDRTEDKEGETVRRVKFKLHSKEAALDKLMKHLNLYAADRESGKPEVHLHFTKSEMQKMSTPDLIRKLQESRQ